MKTFWKIKWTEDFADYCYYPYSYIHQWDKVFLGSLRKHVLRFECEMVPCCLICLKSRFPGGVVIQGSGGIFRS